ncbi:MAG: adenylate kinase [Bacteroidales bacterium]|jgi:adenylate kinase|nr:adenylate kinase [Bacteroidales bacterium]
MNIVMFGAPGSGKGTQSESIIKNFGLQHISTGDLLRKEIAAGTQLGKIADSYMSKGQLVPDELIIEVLDKMLDEPTLQNGVIFDGFPRTISQAEALQKMLNKRGSDISAIIGLEVPEYELVERIMKRGKISGRSDDNRDTVIERIRVYHQNTLPLKDFYRQTGRFFAVEGLGDMGEIYQKISEILSKFS